MMGVITLWTRAPVMRYRSSVCSKGAFFLCLCCIFTFILPFLIAYRSNGLWLKMSTYQEQPDVHFKHKMIAILHTDHPDQYLIWSTYPTLNDMVSKNFNTPVISSYEEDMNMDGKNDALHFDLDFTLRDDEHVHGVQLLLSFEIQMYAQVRLEMNGLAYLISSSALPGSQLTVLGDLKLNQRQPLKHRGHDIQYKSAVIPENSLDPEDYSISSILEQYFERNLTTQLDNQYSIWTPSSATSSSFLLHVHLKYPVQTIEYTPGVWQVLKMAWIQYLAVMVVFAVVFQRIKEYVFTNQLVPTWNDGFVHNKYL